MHHNTPHILMLANDSDDRYLTRSTIEELNLDVPIRFSVFEEELLAGSTGENCPSLILLSDNTRPQQALETMQKIKSSALLCHVPIVVLCEDIPKSSVQEYYRAGANTVIKKPWSVEVTRNKIRTFFNYWLQVAEL